jgi:hypothetical protein
MSDRKNFFAGQIVTQGDMDGAFDDSENAEFNTHIEAGLAAHGPADSPDCTVYGGIIDGLVVTGVAGENHVHITVGAARDQRGYRAKLPTGGATVLVSHAGNAAEGDATDAVGTGAAIALSCPVIGERIVADLYLVYDENLSDPRTDASGATVYFEVAESFHFYIAIGTPFANPPVGAITVAALESNKVLLAQILLTNNGGNMEVVANGVCIEDQNWDALGGAFYPVLTGRRGDWLSLDQDAHPTLNTLNMSYRFSNPRDALRRYLGQLMCQTSGAGAPAGAELVGAKAVAAGAKPYAPYFPLGLTAGTVDTQLAELRNELNNKVSNGGDNIQPTAAAAVGLSFDARNLVPSATSILLGAMGAAAVPNDHIKIGKKRGHIVLPHMLFEDFMMTGTWNGAATCNLLANNENNKLGSYTVAGAGGVIRLLEDELGGVASLYTAGAAGANAIGLSTGLGIGGDATQRVGMWNCGAAPFCIAMFRFRAPSIADIAFEMGFTAIGAATSRVRVIFDSAVDNNLYISMLNAAGAGLVSMNLQAPLTTAWHTVRICVVSDTTAVAQIDNGPEVTATLAGNLGNEPYCLYAISSTKPAGATKQLYIDQAFAADGGLSTDMA